MPELPEVETVVRTLRPRLVGRPLLRVRVNRADVICPAGFDLAAALAARTVTSIERRGKKIVLSLDDGCGMYVHLGMTGRLGVVPADAPLAPHTHLQIDVGDGELRFVDPRRFGGLFWLGRDGRADANLGPEPLLLRPAQLAARLARTSRAIKNVLLDQSVVAGLGNIYVDESLFAAGIHPLTPADRLTPAAVAALNRAVKAILRRAIRHRGSTLRDYRDADGNSGGFQSLHRVYGREGEACARCRGPIRRIVLGGRSTHFCGNCQPTSDADPT